MTTTILSHSFTAPSVSPYRLHDQFYANMFQQECDDSRDDDKQEAFLGVSMQFPPALVQQRSSRVVNARPKTLKKSESEPMVAVRRNSLGSRSVSSVKTIKTRPSYRQQQPQQQRNNQMSPSELQIQQLYMEARRHQAAAARVTKLEDFRTMSCTLPAAKTSLTLSNNDPSASPSNHCPLIPSAPPSSLIKGNKKRRKAGPMFRGKKSWTSSAAAGSFVAEADHADRYYLKSPTMPRKSQSERRAGTSMLEPALRQIEEEDEDDKKQQLGWKSFLPRKWTTQRSLTVEI